MAHQQPQQALVAASTSTPSSPSPSSSSEEQIIDKTWKKESVLGSGAFGIITLWKNIHTNDFIAIKQSRWNQSLNPAAAAAAVSKSTKERWRQEVELMNRLDHPNVVKSIPVPSCLDVCPSLAQELPSLGMEYCSGGDLRKLLHRPEFVNGLPEFSVRRILEQISSALLYLHSLRIIHRDLKPENIVLKPRKDSFMYDYKLIDLGYCKELDQNSLASSFVGTLQYLAPELFICGQYTSAVDNWSFGLLTHEILTGRRPFLPNAPPAQWIPAVKNKKSEDLCAWMDTKTNQVVYEKEISPFNLVSSVLRRDLESFLRVVLDYDPTKRGEKVAFKLVEEKLKKTVVQVFVMNTLQVFSYEITSRMKMVELKVLIESNTGFARSDQIILVPPASFPLSRTVIHTTDSSSAAAVHSTSILRSLLFLGELGSALDQENALKCLTGNKSGDGSYDNSSPRTLFLFHRNHPLSFTQYSVSSIIPPSVEAILLNPTKLVSFEDQKAIWPHFIWVAQVLIQKYNYLIQGHDAFLHHVLQLRENTMNRMRLVLVMKNTLNTRKSMIREQLIFLTQRLRPGNSPSPNKGSNNSLLTSCDRILRELTASTPTTTSSDLPSLISSLNAASRVVDTLTHKCLKEKIFDPHRVSCECIFSESFRDHGKIYQIYQHLLTLFEEMRCRSREDRSRQTKLANSTVAFDNTPVVKAICDIFQLMEKLIRTNYQALGRLLDLSKSLNSLSKKFKKMLNQLEGEIKNNQNIYSDFMTEVLSCSALPTPSSSSSSSKTDVKMSQKDLNSRIDRLTEQIKMLGVDEEAVVAAAILYPHIPHIPSSHQTSLCHDSLDSTAKNNEGCLRVEDTHTNEFTTRLSPNHSISNESSWSFIN